MTTVHALRTWPVFLAELAPAVREAGWLSITKGAGDAMLECCTQVLVDGRVEKLEPAVRERLTADVDVLTRQGIRVLGVGVRAVTAMPASDCAEGLEQDLVYLGAIGMIDPPRPEARDAVATCGRAGIRAVMITGDHPLTARTIAAELGIAKPEGRVLTGADLQRMTPEALREVVDEVDVYARVSPEHKLRIVEALQARGHVVAMTGDGVNDAPALKRADIGVAMGSGTDVAKEAAEMVLVDDDFATIVAAVEEGRVVYDNLRRFLAFSVTGNVGKVLIVALPPLFGMPLLLKPIQILFSNLLTDGLLGLGMGVERPERDVMSRAPISPGEGVLAGRLGVQVAWLGPLMAAVTIGIGAWYWTRGAANWGAMVFTTLAFLQLGRTLATRSFREPAWRLSPLTNRPLLGLWVAALALQLVAVYLPAAQPFFQTLALSATDLGIAAACGVAVFAAMELEKAFVRRRSAA